MVGFQSGVKLPPFHGGKGTLKRHTHTHPPMQWGSFTGPASCALAASMATRDHLEIAQAADLVSWLFRWIVPAVQAKHPYPSLLRADSGLLERCDLSQADFILLLER